MSVTLHTELGDIKIELNCSDVKKSSYNFLALCASGYYDNSVIHRNIKGFMVQMGDPTGTGKGGASHSTQSGTSMVNIQGTSIWNRKFEDEIVPSLRVCLH
jgi:peptidyl-prolyl cis-trans isomerase-like 3